MKKYLLVHYSEIGLKGSNKDYFVNKLKRQVKEKLEKRFSRTFEVREVLSRIMVVLPESYDESEYCDVMNKILGVKNYQFVTAGPLDIDKLGKVIFDDLPEERGETFRVMVKRSQVLNKKSVEYEREIGAILLQSGIDMKVKMKAADFVVRVEIFNDCAYYSYRRYEGLGGLSANSGGKLIATISAGIDSPVAAYRMMRRGARIIFVHFHAFPYTDDEEMRQVRRIVEILGEYQFDTKLYMVPYGEIMERIAVDDRIPTKIRTVLYRRFMLRIAGMVAKKEGAKGIVTGDSFGQVASQTSDNLFVIDEVSRIPVYRPLIGDDKEEIIEIARKIGTYDISALPCKDPCVMYAPKNPELKANLYDVLRYEELIDVDGWCEEVFDHADVDNA